MSRLSEQQSRFAAAIERRGETGVSGELFLGRSDRVENLIGIYRGNAHANWSKALQSAYPVVLRLVGEEFFTGLVREYGRAEPSVSGDLNLFGDAFAEFLASFPPTLGLSYLPDVARLEWAVHRAFYAADAPRLDLAILAAIREDRLSLVCFRLAPACAVVRSRFPIVRIWEVHQPDYEGEIEVNIDTGGEIAFVHRPAFRVEVARIEAGEAAFLAMCEKGRPLAAAVDAALAAQPAFDLQATLLRWVRAGVIVAIDGE